LCNFLKITKGTLWECLILCRFLSWIQEIEENFCDRLEIKRSYFDLISEVLILNIFNNEELYVNLVGQTLLTLGYIGNLMRKCSERDGKTKRL